MTEARSAGLKPAVASGECLPDPVVAKKGEPPDSSCVQDANTEQCFAEFLKVVGSGFYQHFQRSGADRKIGFFVEHGCTNGIERTAIAKKRDQLANGIRRGWILAGRRNKRVPGRRLDRFSPAEKTFVHAGNDGASPCPVVAFRKAEQGSSASGSSPI